MRTVFKRRHAVILEVVRFEGTPAQFASVVRSNREVPDDPLCLVDVIGRDPPDPEFCQVCFARPIPNREPDFWQVGITAESAPGGKSRIRVYIPPDNVFGFADAIRAYWQFLRPELVRLGGIVETPSQTTTDVLDVIPEQYREIVRMRREGYPAKEIGEAVGLSPGRVHNILSTLRRKYGSAIVPNFRKS